MSLPPRSGETRTTPITLPTLVNGQSLESAQACFPLSEADFLRLQSSDSNINTVAGWILSAWVGFIVSVLPKVKVVDGALDHSNFSTGEFVTIALLPLAVIILRICGVFFPSPRRDITKKLKKYFSDYQARQSKGQP